MSLRLSLLGGLRVFRDDVELPELPRQPQRCALLIYLALERSATRHQVISVLWPDADDDRARHVLNQTLYQLRSVLGNDIVHTNGERLEIAPQVISDASQFAELVGAGVNAAAVRVYQGELLAGATLVESSAFNHWLDAQRARFSRLHRTGRRSLLDECSARADWQAALQCAREWVRVDPLEDEAQHRLIELLAAHGSRSEALQQFELYVRSLRELGLEPLPETVQLAAGLRAPQEQRVAGTPRVERRGLQPLATPPRELSRTRIAILHASATWLVIQIVATIFPRLGLPAWWATAAAVIFAVVVIGIHLWGHPRNTPIYRLGIPQGYVNLAIPLAIFVGTVGLFARFYAWRDADPRRVAILPFRVISSDSSLTQYRMGMPELLHSEMDGSAGLSAVYPQTLFSAWRRAGGKQWADLSAASTRRIARKVRAHWLLSGEVIEARNAVTIQATLIDAKTFARHEMQRVTGPADSIPALVDQLTARLLGDVSGQDPERVTRLGSVQISAVKAYLKGVAYVRAGDYSSAYPELRKALEIDSTFAIAALKAINVAGWLNTGELHFYEMLAYRHRDHLGPRDQAYLFSWLSPTWPNFTIKSAIEGGLRHVQLAPDQPEGWFLLGDRFVHNPLASGSADPDGDAERYMTRAMDLDPDYHEPLEHLIEIAHRKGDTAQVRRWRDQYFRSAAQTADRAFYVRWRSAWALGEGRTLDSLRHAFDRAPASSLRAIVMQAEADGFGYQDIEPAIQALTAHVLTPHDLGDARAKARQFALLQGQPAKAFEIMRSRPNPPTDSVAYCDVILRTALLEGPLMVPDSTLQRVLRVAGAFFVAPLDTVPEHSYAPVRGMVLYAEYLARYGPIDSAQRVLHRVTERIHNADLDPVLKPETTRMLPVIDLQLAMRLGSIDEGMIDRIDALVGDAGFDVDPAFKQLVFAEANLKVNRPEKALREVAWGVGGLGTSLQRLLLAARAARAAGDRPRALRWYRQVLELRRNPEPTMVSWRNQVLSEYRALLRQTRP